jgi:hypothetical protein
LFDEKKIILGKIEEIVCSIEQVEEIKYLTEEEFFDF